MSVKFICDGCGVEAPAESHNGNWFKPREWYERRDDDGIQTACSRRCIDTVAARSGKTRVVLPI